MSAKSTFIFLFAKYYPVYCEIFGDFRCFLLINVKKLLLLSQNIQILLSRHRKSHNFAPAFKAKIV